MPRLPHCRAVARALRLDTNTVAQSGLAFVIAYTLMYFVSRV